MTVDEMVGRLDQFGQRATDLTDILTQIGTEITAEIRSRAHKTPVHLSLV